MVKGGIEPPTAWGVVVPDLPGCFSAGDTMEEALTQAEAAIGAWIETAIDHGEAVPEPFSIDTLRADDRKGWMWALVKVDPAILDTTLERIKISLPVRSSATTAPESPVRSEGPHPITPAGAP